MKQNIPKPDTDRIYKFARHRFERYKGTIMVDFFDKDYNRYYFHLTKNGLGLFETFNPRRHLRFNTKFRPDDVRSVYHVADVLKEQGIQIVITNENME